MPYIFRIYCQLCLFEVKYNTQFPIWYLCFHIKVLSPLYLYIYRFKQGIQQRFRASIISIQTFGRWIIFKTLFPLFTVVFFYFKKRLHSKTKNPIEFLQKWHNSAGKLSQNIIQSYKNGINRGKILLEIIVFRILLMGACVMACSRKQEFMPEHQRTQVQRAAAKEIEKELKECPPKVEPIMQKEILLDIKNNELTSSLTRSWKTETRSRFYKEKASYNSQANTLLQSSETIKEAQSCFASEIMEKNTSKRYKRFQISKQQSAMELQPDFREIGNDNNKSENKDENQTLQSQSINIKTRCKLALPKEGKGQTDRKLIQSTLHISTTTMINQKIKFIDGSTYLGQWRNGRRDGFGKYQWVNGAILEGEWKRNMIEGFGTLSYSDGQKYVGNFIKNQAFGKGEYYFLDGSRYEGDWINSLPDGVGCHYFTEQQKFTGKWSKGMKNGYGELVFEDGTYYKGQFLNNQIQGKGEYNYGDKTYKGLWEHNEKSGLGCMLWADGNRYQGSFLHDKMHGKGKLYDINGTIYEGKWLKGRKDGRFLEHRPNGEKVKSEWYYNKLVRQFQKADKNYMSSSSQNY